MGVEKHVRQCYGWHTGNMRVRSWVKEMKEQLDSVGLIYVCGRASRNVVKLDIWEKIDVRIQIDRKWF
jgi:hypothetical protein